jgi:hypothetical protein
MTDKPKLIQINIRVTPEEYTKLVKLASKNEYAKPQSVAVSIFRKALADAR